MSLSIYIAPSVYNQWDIQQKFLSRADYDTAGIHMSVHLRVGGLDLIEVAN